VQEFCTEAATCSGPLGLLVQKAGTRIATSQTFKSAIFLILKELNLKSQGK
jgi:hypothetical protein